MDIIRVLVVVFFSFMLCRTCAVETKRARLAVVIPHIPGDEKKIRESILSFPPCEHATGGLYSNTMVDLILYSSKKTFDAKTVKAELSPAEKCFRSIHVLRHGILEEEEIWIYAPNLLWRELMRGYSGEIGTFMRDSYDHMMLMEPDVYPVVSSWAYRLALLLESEGKATSHPDERWWVMGNAGFHSLGGGSKKDDDNDASQAPLRIHINGNALYKLGDDDFEDYIDRAFDRFMIGTRFQAITGYDSALTEYMFENIERVVLHMHRFRFSNFILNNQEQWIRDADRQREFETGRFSESVLFIHKGSWKHDGPASDEDVARMASLSRDTFEVGAGLRMDHKTRKGEQRNNRSASGADAELTVDFHIDGKYYRASIPPETTSDQFATGICATELFSAFSDDAEKRDECYRSFKERVEYERSVAIE